MIYFNLNSKMLNIECFTLWYNFGNITDVNFVNFEP